MATIEQQTVGNRADRRAWQRQLGKQNTHQDYLRQVILEFNQAKNTTHDLFKRERSFASVVYQGGADDLLKYYSTLSSFSLTRRNPVIRKSIEDQPEILEEIDADDIYTCKVRGISLEDIGNFPYPLSLESIRIINKFLRYYKIPFIPFMPVHKKAQHALAVAMLLPTLDLVQSKKGIIPPPLQPLHDRLQNYLDYYLGFITPPYLLPDQEYQFYKIVAYTGPSLAQALGVFMPARLGITPSSSIKLLLEKETFSSLPLGWRSIRKMMEPDIHDAYQLNGLSGEIQKYQDYNYETDRQATTILQAHYQNHHFEKEPEVFKPEPLLTRFQRYIGSLRRDTLSATERYLSVPVDHGIVKKIILASQYRSSIMVIVLLSGRGGNEYLTLEVGNGGRLYGIPPELVKEMPHIEDVLTGDIINLVIEFARQQHPNIEPRPIVRLTAQPAAMLTTKPPQSVSTGIDQDQSPEIDQEELIIPKTKRNQQGRLSVIALLQVQEPILPQPVEQKPPVCKVKHTRTQIERLMGKNRPGDIERIMEVIQRLERGLVVDIKQLTALSDLTRLRVGKWRVVLNKLGQEDGLRVYGLAAILRRDDNTSSKIMRRFH